MSDDRSSIGKILQNARNSETVKSSRSRPKGKRSDPDYTVSSIKIQAELLSMVKIAILSNPDVKDLSSLIETLLQTWIEQEEIYSYLKKKKSPKSNHKPKS